MRFALFCLAASLVAVCASIVSAKRLSRPLREWKVNRPIWQDNPNNVFDDEVEIIEHFDPTESTIPPPTTRPPPPPTTTQPPPPPTTTQPPPPPTTTQPPPPPTTTQPPPPSTTTQPPPPPPPSTTTQPPLPSSTIIGSKIFYPTPPSWPNYPPPNYPPPNYPPANYPPPNYPPANYPQPPTTTADPMCPQGPSGECRELPLGQRGSLQVRNDGGVTLQFFVEYKVRGRKVYEESGQFGYTYKRIKEIPADAEDIILTVQGVAWGATSDIMKKQWKYPVIRCYSSTDGQRVTQVGCN